MWECVWGGGECVGREIVCEGEGRWCVGVCVCGGECVGGREMVCGSVCVCGGECGGRDVVATTDVEANGPR